MLGHKARDFRQHVSVSLDGLVPDDNFYRHVEDCIDLSFVRNLASDFYSDMGRPSIDPVVFFKLQLIAFLAGQTNPMSFLEEFRLSLPEFGRQQNLSLCTIIQQQYKAGCFRVLSHFVWIEGQNTPNRFFLDLAYYFHLLSDSKRAN